MSHIIPFERDQLFLSIYEACRHRPKAIADATALTDTIIHKLLQSGLTDAVVERSRLRSIAHETLGTFDQVAQIHYGAFHPMPKSSTN